MNALQISKDLYTWLNQKERQGKIHSIFTSTINIISEDGKFIPIVINDKPISPNSIKLDSVVDFKKCELNIGDKVIFSKSDINVNNITISIDGARVWDNSINLSINVDGLESISLKLGVIKQFIREKGNKNGIFQLMQLIPCDLYSGDNNTLDSSQLFIKDRFISFIRAFRDYDIRNINILSKKIIGFGPGLTPSMDDFLSGIMIAHIYFSYLLELNMDLTYEINHQIVHNIENKTTRVSEEMLKHSSIGETNEDIRNLMVHIISKENDKSLNDLLESVINFGHSSGTDILCGIYIGSCILIEAYEENYHL